MRAQSCFAPQAARKSAAGALLLAGSALVLVPLSPAQAQDVAPPTRDELAPPQLRDETRPATTLTIDGSMERTPCALDNPEYANINVNLIGVRFVGAEKAPDVTLVPTYQDYLGRELPLSVLCDIRSAANARLQAAGYLATVEIPAQRLSGGEAELRIVFGRLTALRVRGEAGPSEALVTSYLEPLTADEVFNTNRAERALLLTDDLPGLDVRLTLRPAAGGQPGDLVGEVAVLRRRGAIDFNVQNFGSRALGRIGGLLRGEIYDITGLGDRTSLSLFSTADFDEQQTVQLGHDFGIGGDGLRLGGQVTYSWTNPDLGLAGFDVKSETLFATLNASYPLRRSRSATHLATLGLDYVDQDVEINQVRLTRDRVRMAFLRLDSAVIDPASIGGAGGYTIYEPRLRAHGAIQLRQGLDVLGAAPDCRPAPLACILAGQSPARIEADPTPTVLRIEGQADFRPAPLFKLSMGVDGQFTRDPLPAFEEFAAGNYSIGRGYDPGSVLGDSGIGLSLEAAYGSLVPRSPTAFAWQPYVFTDMARAWNRDPSRRPFNPDRLWSAGGGLRFAWGSRLVADVTLAVPLTRPDLAQTRGDARLMFSLTTRLFPWSF